MIVLRSFDQCRRIAFDNPVNGCAGVEQGPYNIDMSLTGRSGQCGSLQPVPVSFRRVSIAVLVILIATTFPRFIDVGAGLQQSQDFIVVTAGRRTNKRRCNIVGNFDRRSGGSILWGRDQLCRADEHRGYRYHG